MSEQTTEPGTIGRRELNKRQTRARLLASARELFDEVGMFATAEEIADRAEVSRATFFNYFRSKDELLAALYAELNADLGQMVDELVADDRSTADRIIAVFTEFARHVEAESGFLLAFTAELERMSTPEQVAERSEELHVLMGRLLAPGLTRGEVRDDLDLPFLAQMVAAIYVSVIRNVRAAQDPAGLAQRFEQAGRFAAQSIEPR